MFLLILSLFFSLVLSVEILYDGRARLNFDAGVLDNSSGPYLTYVVSLFSAAPTEDGFTYSAVRGSETASHVCPSDLSNLYSTAEPNPVHSIRPHSLPNTSLERPIQQHRSCNRYFYRQQLSLCSWRQYQQCAVWIPENRTNRSAELQHRPTHSNLASEDNCVSLLYRCG